MYFPPNHGLRLSTMSTKATQTESDLWSHIKQMGVAQPLSNSHFNRSAVYTYVWAYRSTIYTLYCSHLPSGHGLGPMLWVCPCMAGVGQGLDWGPPIGAIGMPVVHKGIFMSIENDILMILNTSDNYHQINHLYSNKYHTNDMIPVTDTNINTSMAMYYHAFLPISNFLIT